MAKRDRAAYMAAYRARKRRERAEAVLTGVDFGVRMVNSVERTRIAELEEEVRHLKEELAKRAKWIENHNSRSFEPPEFHAPDPRYDTFNSKPFTPVPKNGKPNRG